MDYLRIILKEDNLRLNLVIILLIILHFMQFIMAFYNFQLVLHFLYDKNSIYKKEALSTHHNEENPYEKFL